MKMQTWNEPVIISEINIGEAWLSYLQEILNNGHDYFDGEEKIIERENIMLQIMKDDINDIILDRMADKEIINLYLKKCRPL